MGMIIFMLIGKSSCGKDTIYKELLKQFDVDPIVVHTTRSMRVNEIDGVTYHFDTYDRYKEYVDSNEMVASSKYTLYDKSGNPYDAYYYTVKDDLLIGEKPKIVIGNPNLYSQYISFLGLGIVYPIIIEVDDGVKLERALKREREQIKPNYLEMCRRFIRDSEDYSPENFKMIGLDRFPSFENDNLHKCIDRVSIYIKAMIKAYNENERR